MTELIEYLTSFAKSMKAKGHSKEAQSLGMKTMFDKILEQVYK